MRTRSILLIAGEASGDTLAAELVHSLKKRAEETGESLRFTGAGGARMVAAGVELEFDLAAHAVVGIVEVLKNYGKFKAFFDQLLKLALDTKPDAIILIDYPGFNLRYAKKLRSLIAKAGDPAWKPKIIYYVSPQIWAWHESRVRGIARDIDLMLSIFPFEKKWYAERVPSFRVEFVGHPLVDRFTQATAPQDDPAKRGEVLLLPGSRQRELRKHLPVLIEAGRGLCDGTGLIPRLVVSDQRMADLAAGILRDCPALPTLQVQIGGLADALGRARTALAASGTVTMECAWFGVPTVVLYKTSWSTYWLARNLIKVKFLAMPNLLADEAVFPEFIQNEANAANLIAAAKPFLSDTEIRRNTCTKLAAAMRSLGTGGASDRAAAAVWSVLVH